MKRENLAWTLAAAIAAAGAPQSALAIDAQLFNPAVDGRGYIQTYSAQSGRAGDIHLGVWYNFADDIGVFPDSTSGREMDVLDQVHQIDLVGSYSLLDWLEIGFDIPVADTTCGDIVGCDDGQDFDDFQLQSKIRLLDPAEYPLGIAVIPFVDIAAGNDARLTSNGGFDYGGLVAFESVGDDLRAAFNAGYQKNKRHPALGADTDDILFGAAVGLKTIQNNQSFLFGLLENLELIADVWGLTIADDAFEKRTTPIELSGGFHVWYPSGFWWKLGAAGKPYQSDVAAKLRAFAAIGYTTPPPPPPLPPAPAPPPPPPPQVVVTDEEIIPLEPIYFDFDRDTIKRESYPILDQVTAVMNDRSAIRVRIEGHTDSFGTDNYNEGLAERRSKSVKRYLIGKGIDGGRLDTAGFGENRPIATNDTSTGRAKNRRTEFHIIK